MTLSESIPDVSYYQQPVDDSFDKRGLIFRLGDGNDFLDPNFAANLAWSQKAYADGRIDLFGIYHVYRPLGAGTLHGYVTAHLPQLPAGAFFMWDIESWGGAIVGDHSADLNTLYGMSSGWAGDFRRVIAYANIGDFAQLYPWRDPRCKANEAGYGSTVTHVPGAILKQWTNGQPQYDIAGLSPSSPPFGRCDHNVFIGMSLTEAAMALGITAQKDEDDMPAASIEIYNTEKEGIWALFRPEGSYVHLATTGDVAALVHTGTATYNNADTLSDGTHQQLKARFGGTQPLGATVAVTVPKVTVPVSGTVEIGN